MKQNDMVAAKKIAWDETARIIEKKVAQILGHQVECQVSFDDVFYWGAAAVNYQFPVSELKKLLHAVQATQEECQETVPLDSDYSSFLGMGLSRRLLSAALHAKWESEHCDDKTIWLLNYCEISE